MINILLYSHDFPLILNKLFYLVLGYILFEYDEY